MRPFLLNLNNKTEINAKTENYAISRTLKLFSENVIDPSEYPAIK